MFLKKLKKALVVAVAGCMVLGSTMTSLAAGEAYKVKDLFVADTYVEEYDDVQNAVGKNAALNHYLTFGIKEGRDSSLTDLIDLKKYREAYPDLDAAFGDNWDAYLNHYLTFGFAEGRKSFGTFDATFYAQQYPDLMAAFGNDVFQLYRHYLQFGASEGRSTFARVWGTPSTPSTPPSGGGSVETPVYEEVSVGGNLVDPETGDAISGVAVYARLTSQSTGLIRTASAGDSTVTGGDSTVTGGDSIPEGFEPGVGQEVSEGLYLAYTDENGGYVFPTLIPGTYTITVDAEGYIDLVFDNVVVDGQTQVQPVERIELLSTSSTGTNAVFGKVVDATVQDEGNNENALAGVTVTFREGWGNAGGEVVATGEPVITAECGSYYVELPRGYYTATFTKDGYITRVENVLSLSTERGVSQDVPLAPAAVEEGGDGDYRIVLTWGEVPRDLDSHLYGRTETSETMFHVYFSDKQHFEGDVADENLVAMLDVDDTTSFGPETVTILRDVAPGSVYRYSVHDWTNGGDSESYEMSNSGAQVNVYRGATLVRTYNIPANMPGYIWNVFEINGDGVITSFNTINSEYSSMEIQTAE